jgi:opacity protein-like surface antigen
MVGAQQAVAGPSGYTPPPAPPVVYGAGTTVIRVGASFVDPDDDKGRLRFEDDFFADDIIVPGDRDRLRYRLDDDTTWNFTVGYMPVEHFMVELGYIGKSDHDLDLRARDLEFIEGPGGEVLVFADGRRNLKLGEVSRWSGFGMVNWFPVCPESWVQPYVGIGAHYTSFDNHDVRGVARDFLADFAGALEPVDGRVRYENDWGWGAQLGVDIMFGRDSNWLANAAVMYLDTEADADLHYRIEAERFVNPIRALRTDFDLDPWVYNLGIGYKF